MTTTLQREAAASALAGQQTYREHLHRSVMLPMEPEDHRLSGVGEAFWPTRRDIALPDPIQVPNVNCQRCGKAIAPTAGWWCRECFKIVPLLQCYRGMSMVMIAAMGESDPHHSEWVQDYAPWLIAKRIEFIQERTSNFENAGCGVRASRRTAPRQDRRAGRTADGRRRMMPRIEQVWEAA